MRELLRRFRACEEPDLSNNTFDSFMAFGKKMTPKEKAHLIIREYLSSRPTAPLMTADCSPNFWDWISSDPKVSHSPPPKGAGHPFELDKPESAAFASAAASMAANQLMQRYRKRFGTNRVPEDAKKEFIRLVMNIYPKASADTIKERIRVRNKDLFSGGLGLAQES